MPSSARRVRKPPSAVAASVEAPADFNVGTSIRHTFRLMHQRLHERLQSYDIPVAMFYFLLTLWKGDGLTQRELSDRVGIMGPGTVEQLHRMEKRGLIKRVPSRTDRRKMHVFLTPKGRSLTSELLPQAHKNNATALRGFTAAETQVLRNFLGRIRENMSVTENVERTNDIHRTRPEDRTI